MCKINTFLATVFLILFHKYNWDYWPNVVLTDFESGYKNDKVDGYHNKKTVGLPSSKVLK